MTSQAQVFNYEEAPSIIGLSYLVSVAKGIRREELDFNSPPDLIKSFPCENLRMELENHGPGVVYRALHTRGLYLTEGLVLTWEGGNTYRFNGADLEAPIYIKYIGRMKEALRDAGLQVA